MSLHLPNSHWQSNQTQENPAPGESDAKDSKSGALVSVLCCSSFHHVTRTKPSQITAQETGIHVAKAALLI